MADRARAAGAGDGVGWGSSLWPAVAAGLAAAAVAWRAPAAALAVLAIGAVSAGALVAVRRPGCLVAALLGLVVVQDMLVAVGLPYAQQADEAVVAVLGLVAGWRLARRGRFGPPTPWDGPLAAFVGVAAFGAAWRLVPPVVAVLGILAVTKGALAGTAAARVPLGRAGVRRAADAAAGAVAASGFVAVLQRLGGEAAFRATGQLAHFGIWHGAKAPGLFAHHNALAHAAVLAGAWWLGRRAAGLPAGAAVRVAELATAAGLIASASREGWVAAVAGLVAIALLAPRGGRVGAPRGHERMRRAAAGLALALLAAGSASYALSPTLRAEMARRVAGVPAGWRDFDLGLSDWAFRGEYRVYALRKSVEVWVDQPWLGTGPGRFGGAVAERFGSPVYDDYAFLPLDGRFAPLDLFWARLPAEFGLLGAAAFLWLAVAGVRAVLAGRRDPDALLRALAIGGGGAWAAAGVLAAFAPSFEDPLVAIPLWLWTAAAWRLGLPASPAPVGGEPAPAAASDAAEGAVRGQAGPTGAGAAA